jgi:hypothetical protein
MESERLDVERFIPLLRAHLGGVNPYVRQLLVGWVTALDSVPGVAMLDWLPELLEGLFDMLSDVNRDIRQQVRAGSSRRQAGRGLGACHTYHASATPLFLSQAYTALSDFLDQMCKQPMPSGPGGSSSVAAAAGGAADKGGKSRWATMVTVLVAQVG